jgi:hypothetical protein
MEKAVIVEAPVAETTMVSSHKTTQCGSSQRCGWTERSTRGQGTAWGGL